MGDTTIPDAPLTTLLESLDETNARAATSRAARATERQPIHTVYGGAHLFRADTAQKLGATALATLREYAPDGGAMADAMGIHAAVAERIYPRVIDKLQREPVEDYRIDFEDGFGNRSDEEEDRTAKAAADELASGMAAGTLPPEVGIRIKPLSDDLKRRSLRTLDLFLTRLLDRTAGALPPRLVVALPKIVSPGHVAALASACDAFEYWRELAPGTLRIELMVETPEALVGPDGRIALPSLVEHGRGRVVAVHLGPYDFTAACGVTAADQDLAHPLCAFARQMMQVSLAGTGVHVADGPTTLLPIPPHRASPGTPCPPAEREANSRVITRAWRLHVDHVRSALHNGFYQGWDLHPAQLPARYAAVYAFFVEGLDAASERLQRFVAAAARATATGGVFDDAATGQGLLNFFLRAVNCGAIDEREAAARSGLSPAELRSRSFLHIVHERRG